MDRRVIYLDYAATSPVDPAVVDAMAACMTEDGAFGNPASDHVVGAAARARVEEARAEVASLVNARPDALVFTAGATEANNLALKGMLRRRGERRRHLVTTRIEHRSVLDAARALRAEGAELSLLDCDARGLIAPEQVAAAIRDDTALVSVMHVNNEIGVVQDIAAIAAVCRARGVPLHVDAAQSAGKIPLDLTGWGVDLCSLTAHKQNGPKGVGALVVRPDLALAPLLHGGEQERGLRAGTLATHQIVGMGKAYALAAVDAEGPAIAGLRDLLWRELATVEGAQRNGAGAPCAPHILNVSFPGVDGESLRAALGDVAVSAGSACASDDPDASHVLSGLGLSDARAQSALRFGLGRYTTERDVREAAARVRDAVARLRRLAGPAPDWCSA